MQNSIYVGLSSQITLERRLDAIAHNIANISTPGFRGEGTKFDTLTSSRASDDVQFASAGKSYIRTTQGPMIATGNPFDVALKGDVWLSVATPQGRVFTRDGRMQMQSDGALVSVTGNPVLDASGQALQLDPAAGAPEISKDGGIYQQGNLLGAIGLFAIPVDAHLNYAGNSGVIPDKPAQAVVDSLDAGVVQGMIEGSNVDGMTEMTRMISVSRAFEQVNALLSQQESIMSEAIKTLGSRSG